MIQMGTVLQVADNTGAKKIACIKMLGGSTAGQYARLGDVITGDHATDETSPGWRRICRVGAVWVMVE